MFESADCLYGLWYNYTKTKNNEFHNNNLALVFENQIDKSFFLLKRESEKLFEIEYFFSLSMFFFKFYLDISTCV